MKNKLLLLLLLVGFVSIGQTSAPINTGKTAVNNLNNYATLFRYVVKKGNDTTSYFGWVNTSPNSVILNRRAKRLNGIFSSGATALANLPTNYTLSGGGGIIDNDFNNAKYIAYMVYYPFNDINATKTAYDEFIQAGANEIVIPIYWADVFPTYSAQTANSSSSWTAYDELITYVKNKGVKVSLRICVDMDDSNQNDIDGTSTNFYGLSNSARDEWNQPTRIGRGSGHSSLAYSTGRTMMLDFAQKALTRYNTLLGTQLLWYSVVMTAQNESGYNYQNQNYLSGFTAEPYEAMFDYSSHAVTGFRSWLTSKYGTVSALNSSWGSIYANISDATPPTTGKTYGVATHADYNALFATNRGKDFWQYNYKLVKDFAVSAKGLSSGMPCKFYAEFGSVSDFASNVRLSSYVKDFSATVDGLKAQFGGYTNKDNLNISLDYLRSNFTGKKISTEAHDIDFTGQYSSFGYHTPAEVKEIATAWLKKGVESQLKEIVFIVDKNSVNYNVMKEVAIDLKSYLNNYNQATPIFANATFSQGEILNSYYDVFNKWKAAGGGTNQRVNLVQTNDFNYTGVGTGGGGGGTGGINVFQIYPIAYYNLKQLDIKSSQFQASYNDNRVLFLAPTHSITYPVEGTGNLAKSSYVVKSLDGQEWIKMTQTAGTRTTGGLGVYDNNHPSRVYSPDLVEDARFYLPIQDYDITITNTGTVALDFEVYQPHNPNPLAFSPYTYSLVAGETKTYRVYASLMNQQAYYERAIKINCNKH